ncbi:MAG: hypothetical protein A2V67_01310 [Deltaproteobacteria bacterium RBG_13_61_14]|nr:MAG: hypothetical protein A2V67_01310 [Deltaproteobacteria bacterium RBG_13_61_14]
MKLWSSYGSEHSANLVMIGRFKEVGDAEAAKEVIDRLTEQARDDERAGKTHIGETPDRYTDGMLDLLSKLNVASVNPVELEQFLYDVKTTLRNDEIVLTTEENEVSAFLKVMIDKGARVEVYSAHDHPGTGYGRGG